MVHECLRYMIHSLVIGMTSIIASKRDSPMTMILTLWLLPLYESQDKNVFYRL